MISQNPERRPACAEIISKLQEIPDITNGIVPFDTKPEHFVYEGPELDLNCFTISKCEILTLLTLNNVSVQISELMKCLENCVNLKYLDLSISQRESGTEKDLGKDLPYRPVNLKHLTNFKLHHLNKLCNSDSLTNITEISTDILRNLLFFESNIFSQIISNKMTISLKLRGANLCQIDIIEGKFVTYCESAFDLFDDLLSVQNFEIIRTMTPCKDLERQGATCRDVELYKMNQKSVYFEEGKLFSSFKLLVRLFLNGCPKTLQTLNFSYLSNSLNILVLKGFQIKFPEKQQPKKLVLSILTLDECLISRDFVDKYDQILEVEVLTIISCQSGGEHCRNFDLVCSVLKTTWDVIRLKPFYWNCTNREFGKSLIEEYFKDVPRGCEMIEIIGNNNVISVVNKEFEYENEFAECTAMVDENF